MNQGKATKKKNLIWATEVQSGRLRQLEHFYYDGTIVFVLPVIRQLFVLFAMDKRIRYHFPAYCH